MSSRKVQKLTRASKRAPVVAHGFTLIELMIAIAILGILVGIALPSYQQYVLRSGRAEAKALLLEASQSLERCYTRDSAYNGDSCALDGDTSRDSENGKYALSIGNLTATTFTLTATAQGGQTKDTECGNFTLDQSGLRGKSGDGDVNDCWGR